jgi:hypothetical protein
MNLEPFIYFCKERESIRVNKDRGASPPWSADEILTNYRFTNVNRESDRVTVWIRQNIREPYADNPNLWILLCMARWINWPDTLAELIVQRACPITNDFRPEDMTAVLESRKAKGEHTFTGAYILRSAFGMSKAKCIAEITLGNLWRDRVALAPRMKGTLQEAHETLMTYPYWGPFMAFQSIADMAHCNSLLANASDRHTWAAAGPGTLRGLNRLHERPFKHPLTQAQALTELRELNSLLQYETRVKLDPLIDTCNLCCEVDKMLRLRNDEGHVRAKYRPGA